MVKTGMLLVDVLPDGYRAGAELERWTATAKTGRKLQERLTMHELMDLSAWRQRHEEMVREVEQNRMTKALRADKSRGSRVFLLEWESRRVAGLLLKFSKTLKKSRKGARL